ncbi:MAG: plasmid pRiA4b ORF-3 family protein [Thermoguttaceae bacterium]
MARARSKPTQIPASQRLYQFKITLRGIKPPIWRRIQVKECTLDELHKHIQTAMGWTNSHLHQFQIDGEPYGDPTLMEDDAEGMEDSTATKLRDIVPEDGKRFRFRYEYDFGDGWEHEILFEGCLPAEKQGRYPLCIEGKRACPPEDVGGVYGYGEYLEAMANPKHERHKEFMEWGGRFNPEKFDAQTATTRMQEGVPDWREEV